MAKRKKKAAAGRKRKPAAAPRPSSPVHAKARQLGVSTATRLTLEVARKAGTVAHAEAERIRARTAKRLNAEVATRDKHVQSALAKIQKRFGEGAVMRLSGQAAVRSVECVSTGFQPLDDILTGDIDDSRRTVAGSGRGMPRGRIVEIFGPEASGKTTFCLELISAFQAVGLVCAFIDAEHALDERYAGALGVNMQTLLMSQPDSGEEALDIAEMLVDIKAADVIVVDSVANLVPQAELDGEMGDQIPGSQARLMGRALRKLTGKVAAHKTILIFVNQIRMKIGVMFGNPETTPGGQALKFYASVRLDIRNMGQMKQGNRVIGKRSRLRVIKNKVAAPNREVFVDIEHGRGFTNMYVKNDPTRKDDDDDDASSG